MLSLSPKVNVSKLFSFFANVSKISLFPLPMEGLKTVPYKEVRCFMHAESSRTLKAETYQVDTEN